MNHEPKLQFRLPSPGVHRQNKHFRGDQIITGSPKDTVGRPSELNLIPSHHSAPHVDYSGFHAAPTQIHHQIDTIPANYINLEKGERRPQVLSQVEPKGNYVWKTLSPGIEISGFLSEEEQSNRFDHAAALGRSEGFDISNVVDTEGQTSIKVSEHRPSVSLPSPQQLKINYDQPQFEKHDSPYNNKEFQQFEKYLKNLRHGPQLFKPEPGTSQSVVQPVRYGPNVAASNSGPIVIKPFSVDRPLHFGQAAASFDQKFFVPHPNHVDNKFLRSHEPLPLPPQKLTQVVPQPQYQTQEDINENPQENKFPAQDNFPTLDKFPIENFSSQEKFPPLDKFPLDKFPTQDKFPQQEKIPKDIFRQGRYIVPSYRSVVQPYRMRVYQRDLLPQYMVGLRPPPMLIRVPKYVQ